MCYDVSMLAFQRINGEIRREYTHCEFKMRIYFASKRIADANARATARQPAASRFAT